MYQLELSRREISAASLPYGLQILLSMAPGSLYKGNPLELSNVDEALDYLISIESIYILCLIILNIINICVFHNYKNIIFINSLILIIVYFILSRREDKKILIFSMLHFAFWGVLIESFIIDRSNKTLFYKEPNLPHNVPLSLIPMYMLFCVSAIYTYNLCKLLL